MTADERTTRIAEIRSRWDKATPPPWEAIPYPGSTAVMTPINHVWACMVGGNTLEAQRIVERNADAIAHAPDDVAWLLAEVERLSTLSDGLIEDIGTLHESNHDLLRRVPKEVAE